MLEQITCVGTPLPTSSAVRRSRLGLILAACSDLDGDLLAAALPRRRPLAPRPGLAWLVADGHRRYAASVSLHDREPGLPQRDGLVMVIDQDDTPLFLGAIHRLFHGVRLDARSTQ